MSNDSRVTEEALVDEDEVEAAVRELARTNPMVLSKTTVEQCKPRGRRQQLSPEEAPAQYQRHPLHYLGLAPKLTAHNLHHDDYAGVSPNQDDPMVIAVKLSPELRQQIEAEILKNTNLFAWSSVDMLGINADFICRRYNLIIMYPPDEVHTSFITNHSNYCYRVMPFGLKNAGATYQRLIDKVFHQQIGRNMEVYVDDMVVKTTSAADHAADLVEAEYEALLAGLRLARDLGARRVSCNSDSKLMVEQLSGTYQAKDVLLQ
ncbi:uncharacterized protein LOC109794453, partial [Cajanus cajan]|uniref:uncharacterized protein LOC109794453 n=1 Tax=Cajanus cajan TaxID=3821 RepID=UPI00098DCF94